MAWLQVHQTLKDHRKLFDAADQLEVEPPHMMGLLVSFWLWALDNAPTGRSRTMATFLFNLTAGRPANSRKKAGGRVDQSREDNTREGNTPPSPSDEGSDGGTKSLVEARFLEFWKAYPKKTGKQYALKAWNKIKPTAELHERIMQAVDAQKRSDQWRRENGRYIPNPSTWLNGGYWDNEEVNEGAENQRDPEQPDSSGRDWGKGFKPADDE